MGRGQGRRHRGAGGRPDRGAAAVEFALVALPLFLILFGIIQYGFLFYQIQGAAAASKDAARWAAEGMAGDGTRSGCELWHDRTVRRLDGFGVGTSLAPSVRADFDVPTEGNPTVTVSVTFTPVQLVPLVPVPATVQRTATMDLESLPEDGGTTCAL